MNAHNYLLAIHYAEQVGIMKLEARARKRLRRTELKATNPTRCVKLKLRQLSDVKMLMEIPIDVSPISGIAVL